MNVRISKFKVILGIFSVVCAGTLNAQNKLHKHAHLGHDDGIESKEEHLEWESETALSLLTSIVEMTEQFHKDLNAGEIHAIHLKLEDFVEHVEHLPELSEEILSDEALLRVFKTGNRLDNIIIQMDDIIHKKDQVELKKSISYLSQLVAELTAHYPENMIREIAEQKGKDHGEKDHKH